ncbi:MAG TPA: hypothetical protein VG871_04900 [Vicinamibacterales bacterium]|nr:hypothetical protein [Vicinamibacterales bacterium]
MLGVAVARPGEAQTPRAIAPLRVGYGTGESYGKYTFEVLSSRLKPGCAETAIVNGILGLIDAPGASSSQEP